MVIVHVVVVLAHIREALRRGVVGAGEERVLAIPMPRRMAKRRASDLAWVS